MKHNELNRREFLKDTTTVMGGIALAGLAVPRVTFSQGDNEFDYIVVGSGAGGGPVACNLARAGFRVLILEAGGTTDNANYEIPIFHPKATEDRSISWDFFVKHYDSEAQNQKDSKYVKERGGVLYPRSATVGGCTAHNAMISLYPNNKDWDDIVKITGDKSWNSTDMRSYYQRLEKARYVNNNLLAGERRGTKGWLTLEQTNPLIALKDKKILNILLAAAEEDGILKEVLEKILAQNGNILLDPNSWSYVRNKLDGLYNIPKATSFNYRNGTREYILRTFKDYPNNLFLRTHALATQLIFDENDKTKVRGVEYLSGRNLYSADPLANQKKKQNATKMTAFAGREVILAGGAFNSPQLLMLSGIGDHSQLEKHKIVPRINLPGVGKNLQDRYEVGVVSELDSPFEILRDCTFGGDNDPCMDDFNRGKADLYGTNGVLISQIKRSKKTLTDPDLCIFALPGDFRGYFPGWSKNAYKKNRMSWAILKGQSKNTSGTVTLKSSSPTDVPEINFRYFSDKSGSDLQDVMEAVKYVRKLNQNVRLKNQTNGELVPGSAIKTDAQLKDFVMKEAWGHHASCSNKMGVKNDPMAVVDSEFKVFGTKNLRIVDASVFPKIPGLFIAVPIYMISEKATDVILRSAARDGRRAFFKAFV